MLVFVDESGDSGLKGEEGSSRYFTVALVVFDDYEEAKRCDQRIELLKHELGWEPKREFHFSNNPFKTREAFLQAVAPYNFFYYGIVINKDPQKLYGEGFKDKSSFYKYACSLVFNNAKEKLEHSIIVIDKTGSVNFKYQLAKYLKEKNHKIKKAKSEHSHSNNLLQLADYVAGIINRRTQGKDKENLGRIIAHHEMYVQVWPR